MSNSPAVIDDTLRETIIAAPDIVLDDIALMRALVAANERALGANIVDLRGIAMNRLEARLERLEETHRSVIAAAYENLAGTNQIHRALLRLLDPVDLDGFLRELGGDVADILRVDCVKLLVESAGGDVPAVRRMGEILCAAAPGFAAEYVAAGGGNVGRAVSLRKVASGDAGVYGEVAEAIRSEACLTLDLGPDRLPGLLILGAQDGALFSPQHGTDLLAFFGGVVERSLRRWLP